MMHQYLRRLCSTPFVISLFLSLTTLSGLCQETEAEILTAARNIGLNNTPFYEAVTLKHINEMHHLRSQNKLSNAEYQRVMSWHQIENLSQARRAAALVGLEVEPQTTSPTKGAYRTGSDSDYLVRRKDGRPLTLEDIQAVERAYRMQVNQEIKIRSKKGGRRVAPSISEFNTTTDFMASVGHTTEAEFNRIANHLKARDADAYSRYDAAVVEANMRKPGAKIDIRRGGAYVNEMLDMVANKQSKIDRLQKELKKTEPGGKRAIRINGELDMLKDDCSKYLKRMNDLNAKLASQAGLPAPSPIFMANYDTAKTQYLKNLGNIVAATKGPTARRHAAFHLALQIKGLPKNRQSVQLDFLNPEAKKDVVREMDLMRKWQNLDAYKDDASRLQTFLGKTETGRKLLHGSAWIFKGLTKERGNRHHGAQLLLELSSDLNEVNKKIGTRATQLEQWLALITKIRDAKSDADLAIVLGQTLASKTSFGMIASYAYTGLVKGDLTSLAKSLTIYLCPQAALPDVVRSIGNSTIDLGSSVLFDHQFKALFVAATFDKESGTLLSIYKYEGANPASEFLKDALSSAGDAHVKGVFDEALKLGKNPNMGVEMLSGINAFSAPALVKALASTVQGEPKVMKDDTRLMRSCAEVKGFTITINSFVEGLGYQGSVPQHGDAGWKHPKLEPAAQRKLTQLLVERKKAWDKVQSTMGLVIKKRLESRYRALAMLGKGNKAVEELRDSVEKLFKELDIYDLGMDCMNSEGEYNFILRHLVVETKEQEILMMETLQRYHKAYSAILRTRTVLENYYASHGGTGKNLTPRLLTGAPLLSADPAFDRASASAVITEVMKQYGELKTKLLYIKCKGVNDNAALLDADFDKRILGGMFSSILIRENHEALRKGATHTRSRLYRVQVLSVQETYNVTFASFITSHQQFERRKKLWKEFNDYYKNLKSSVAILPPPAIVEERAVAETTYAFRATPSNVPPNATYIWYDENNQEIGRDSILLHTFDKAGTPTIRLHVEWLKSERVRRSGRSSAELHCVIGKPGDDAEKRPSVAIVTEPDPTRRDGLTGKTYTFNAVAKNVPDTAEYIWFKGVEEVNRGKRAQLQFDEPGEITLSVYASWTPPGSSSAEELCDRVSFRIAQAADKPKLAIVPPPDILDGTAKTRKDYRFVAATKQIPESAQFLWSLNDQLHRRGNAATYSFQAEGTYTIKLKATWKPNSDVPVESIHAEYMVNIGDPGPTPPKEDKPPAPDGGDQGAVAKNDGKSDGKSGQPDPAQVTLPDSDNPGGPPNSGDQPEATRPATAEASSDGTTRGSGTRGGGPPSYHRAVYGTPLNLDFSGPYTALLGKKPGRTIKLDFGGSGLKMAKDSQKMQQRAASVMNKLTKTAAPVHKGGGVYIHKPGCIFGQPQNENGAGVIIPSPVNENVGCGCGETPTPLRDEPEPAETRRGLSIDNSSSEIELTIPPQAPPKLRFVYHSSPTLEFHPPESSDGKTQVTLTRLGEVKIWADVYVIPTDKDAPPPEKEESPMQIYTVTAPSFSLVCSPDGAKIGQEVRANLASSTALKPSLVNYVWITPTKRMEYSANASSIGFEPTSMDPISLKVEARVPHYGTTLGTITATYKPSAYTVTAKNLGRTGPKPRIWDPRNKSLVPAPERAFAVHEAINLKAEITGSPPPQNVRWQWTVNEGTTMRGSGISDTLSVSRSSVGNVVAKVTATDKNKNILGSDTLSFSVSISDKQQVPPPVPLAITIKAPKTRVEMGQTLSLTCTATGGTAPYTYKWQGKQLSRTSGTYANFVGLEPGDYQIAVTVSDAKKRTATGEIRLTVMGKDPEVLKREKFDALKKEGLALEQAKKLAPAIAKYREALTIIKDPRLSAHVDALQKKLDADARFKDIVAEGYAREKANDIPGAIDRYKQALTLREDSKLSAHVAKLLKQQQLNKFNALKKQGLALEQAKKLAPAISKYREALTIIKDPRLSAHVDALQKKLAADSRFKTIVAEGYAREKANDIPGAIDRYKQALTLREDSKLSAHVAKLLKQQLLNKFDALKKQGLALEQAKKLAPAISKYREALKVIKDPRLSAHVDALQKKLAADSRFKAIVAEGYAREKANDIAGAIDRYKQALTLREDTKLSAHVAKLLKQQQLNKFDALKKQGLALEQAKKLAPAISKYREALKVIKDPRLSAHVDALQKKLAADARSKAIAREKPKKIANSNGGSVQNQPTVSSTFVVTGSQRLVLLSTYHWNFGKGTPRPGTLGLRHHSGKTYGPWRCTSRPGQGGVPNAYWDCQPNMVLPAGTYTVVDSDPKTWAHNRQSGHRGMFEVKLLHADVPQQTRRSPEVAKKNPPIHQKPKKLTNSNGGSVQNQPTELSAFRVTGSQRLVLLSTYHWNFGKGTPRPGTLGVRHSSGKAYGPWRCTARPGQGGVPNAYWDCQPNVVLPAGIYTVVDSDPKTWAHNRQSGHRGMFEVKLLHPDVPQQASRLPEAPETPRKNLPIHQKLKAFSGTLTNASPNASHTITMPIEGTLKITITTGPKLNILGGLQLKDSDKKTSMGADMSIGPNSTKTWSFSMLRAGTYHLLLAKDSRRFYFGPYRVTTSVDSQKFGNDKESNNKFETANALNLNQVVSGHLGARGQGKPYDKSDYWKLNIPSDGELHLHATTSEKLNLRGGIFVYNSDKKSIHRNIYQGPGSSKKYIIKNIKAGTHYIKIEKDGRSFYWGSYQLKCTLVPTIKSNTTGQINTDKPTQDGKSTSNRSTPIPTSKGISKLKVISASGVAGNTLQTITVPLDRGKSNINNDAQKRRSHIIA